MASSSSPPQTDTCWNFTTHLLKGLKDRVMNLFFHEQKPEEGEQLPLAIASSSSPRQMKYQVFLSFRGEDTRHNFTSHLLKALKDTGMNVFFDEDKLEKGEQLSPALSRAIAASNISIIILSKNYASSKSCLTELSDIMDHRDSQRQIVLPIFYHVDPSDVQNLGGSFKTSFEEHQSKRPDIDEVERWKSAFTGVGKLIGWHIKGGKFDRSETDYIKDVVEDIEEKLNNKSRSVSEGLVGIDKQKQAILRMIDEKENLVIGLWGIVGSGKTTLAKAVYNEISATFDACWFVHNVREKCEKQGMESLRNELLSKLLNSVTRIDTPSIGSTLTQQRLENKRVIVVLDDVNDSDQIVDMGIKHFGRGSKIIVTSRDILELEKGGADKIHKVKMLSKKDSLRLFSTFAFKQLNPADEFLDLCYKFLEYAQGSPLALKVVGSLLYKKSREVWKSEVVKLNEYAKPKISQVLERSFDGLDELEKKIFLDIAIFLKGKPKGHVEAFLRGYYNESVVSGISRLLDKCLIEIVTIVNIDGELCEGISMHDMLEEMGKSIEVKDSGNRKRLWSTEDAVQMLRYNKGAHSVEGIKLNKFFRFDDRWLRFSVFQNIAYLPDEISGGDILEELWNEDHEDFVNLRKINVFDCENLRKIPDLSGAKKLEILDCYGCESLVGLPNLDHLASLEWFDFGKCKSLRKIPSLPGALNLKTIRCSECSSLVELPSLDHEDLINLREIDVSDCKNLRKISNLSRAINLKFLNCSDCESLVELPSLNHLASLEKLDLSYCKSLRKIPNLSGALDLKFLNCCGCESLVELPCLNHLASLEKLDLSYCKSLRKIPNLSGALNLKIIKCFGCSSLVEFPSLNLKEDT